jgi:hypothetical protein
VRDALLPEAVGAGETLIEYLAVHPAARRRGVAGALLAWADAAATAGVVGGGGGGSSKQPPRRLGLWVAASNGAARAMYARAGFTETDRTETAGALTRAACAAFLGEAGWVRMERPLAAAGGKMVLVRAPSSSSSSPPPSPRLLASFRPAV